MPNLANVSELVVANGLCVGCGVCVGVCPEHSIKMERNKYGENIPIKVENCTKACGLCLNVCPFSSVTSNETVIAKSLFGSIPNICHSSETGYYLNTYAGFASKDLLRKKGASGGLATWVLLQMLEKRMVDYVINVTHKPEPVKLFDFQICDAPEQIMEGSRSCYYPVEISSVIQQILDKDGKYAIIALPCYSKALRLAMSRSNTLSNRITFILGLVCGQMKSTAFLEYFISQFTDSPNVIQKATFRIKDNNRPASDFGLLIEGKIMDNAFSKTVFWTEGMNKIWNYGYFKINACNYCDDIFAETADISLMDAWLPQYSMDPRGTSLVLTRHPDLETLIRTGRDDRTVVLDQIDIEKVIMSQNSVIHDKRNGTQHRCFVAHKKGKYVPKKRWEAKKSSKYFQGKIWDMKTQIQNASRKASVNDKSLKSHKYRFILMEFVLRLLIRLNNLHNKFNSLLIKTT